MTNIFDNIETQTLIELLRNIKCNFSILTNDVGDIQHDHSAHFQLHINLLTEVYKNSDQYIDGYPTRISITYGDILEKELEKEINARQSIQTLQKSDTQ